MNLLKITYDYHVILCQFDKFIFIVELNIFKQRRDEIIDALACYLCYFQPKISLKSRFRSNVSFF